jgi:hypothetical protein
MGIPRKPFILLLALLLTLVAGRRADGQALPGPCTKDALPGGAQSLICVPNSGRPARRLCSRVRRVQQAHRLLSPRTGGRDEPSDTRAEPRTRPRNDHAGGRFVGELGIEREAELGEEGRGSLEVFDRQVDEDLGGHHGSLSKIDGRVVGLHLPGNQGAQPLIAQVQAAPEQGAEDDREDDRKRPAADPDVRGDGAPQIARQQDGAENGGAWNHVEDRAGQQRDPRPRMTLSG